MAKSRFRSGIMYALQQQRCRVADDVVILVPPQPKTQDFIITEEALLANASDIDGVGICSAITDSAVDARVWLSHDNGDWNMEPAPHQISMLMIGAVCHSPCQHAPPKR